MQPILVVLAIFSHLYSCSNSERVDYHYKNFIKSQAFVNKNKNESTIVILVDGLSMDILQSAMKKNKIPNISRFFLRNNGVIYSSKAEFPTLTYPNISSLLTGLSVAEHGVLGNKILIDQEVQNFENPAKKNVLNDLVRDKTIFSYLNKKNIPSLSLDYYFSGDASVKIHTNINSGLAYNNEKFLYLDHQSIQVAVEVLTTNKSNHWPGFIFLHLMGVDSLSHLYGPKSSQVLKYLTEMDRDLGRLLKHIDDSKTSRNFVTILTSDHGSVSVSQYFPIEKILPRLGNGLSVLKQGRVAFTYLKEGQSLFKKAYSVIDHTPAIKYLIKGNPKEIVIYGKTMNTKLEIQNGNCSDSNPAFRIALFSKNNKPIYQTNTYLCGDQLGSIYIPNLNSAFIVGLIKFYQSTSAPDLVFIADKKVSFLEEKGSHGGDTLDEFIVPVLINGGKPKDPHDFLSTQSLLDFIKK